MISDLRDMAHSKKKIQKWSNPFLEGLLHFILYKIPFPFRIEPINPLSSKDFSANAVNLFVKKG